MESRLSLLISRGSRALLPAGIFALALALSGALFVSSSRPALAAKTIHVGDSNNNSLAEVQNACLSKGGIITSWTFIINQLDRSQPKPNPVTVNFDTNGDGTADTNVNVAPGTQGGASNAHYTVTGTGVVKDATASVTDGWGGQFVLSHVDCAPPLNACSPFPNRVVITFNALLGNPAFGLAIESAPVAVNIPAGTYAVTLQSFDEHSAKPNQVQPNEQWFARFTTATGTVDSGIIGDLPDNLDVLNQKVGNVVFASTATSVVAHHREFFQSPESIIAVCAALDPVQ